MPCHVYTNLVINFEVDLCWKYFYVVLRHLCVLFPANSCCECIPLCNFFLSKSYFIISTYVLPFWFFSLLLYHRDLLPCFDANADEGTCPCSYMCKCKLSLYTNTYPLSTSLWPQVTDSPKYSNLSMHDLCKMEIMYRQANPMGLGFRVYGGGT